MTVAIAAVAAGWAATAVALVELISRLQRAHARREDLLVNQLLHAAGKAWQPPPADRRDPPAEPTVGPVEWTAVPEQFPVPS